MLVALLVLLSGGAAGLYSTGYWDTWEDKKEEVAAHFRAQLDKEEAEAGQPIPEVGKKVFSECSASALTTLAEEAGCELGEPAMDALVACAKKDPDFNAQGGFALMNCLMEAQTAAMLEAMGGAAEQEAP
jgi:hypothetical protein